MLGRLEVKINNLTGRIIFSSVWIPCRWDGERRVFLFGPILCFALCLLLDSLNLDHHTLSVCLVDRTCWRNIRRYKSSSFLGSLLENLFPFLVIQFFHFIAKLGQVFCPKQIKLSVFISGHYIQEQGILLMFTFGSLRALKSNLLKGFCKLLSINWIISMRFDIALLPVTKFNL